MTLTELRYIIAVARERHFGRAAESCHVSQPTLSVAVKKLEDELGVILFERNTGEVTLTPIGERVVEQAQRALEEADAVKQVARAARDQLVGPLRLGVIYTIAPYLLPRLIPQLHQTAPQMPLIIQENYTSVLAEHLRQGELDAIIVALPFALPNVETTPLYREPFVVALPSGHPWSKRKRIESAELATERLLLLGPGHCFRDQVLQSCPACLGQSTQADTLQQTLLGSSLETLRLMVASGAGITVLPCSAAAPPGLDSLLTIRPLAPPAPNRQVVLAWRRSFPRPRAIETLRDAILACPPEGVTTH